jgi:peptide/nickel transport system permease protein
MNLWAYLVRRLVLAIPVIVGVTILTFGISWEANQGDMARAYISAKMTPEQVEEIRVSHGFDKPFYVQYLTYLKGLVKGDLGLSRTQGDLPISQVFKAFFPATLELTIVAVILAVVGGVFFGTLSAVRKDRPIDHATRVFALAGVSVPIFWLGLILKFIFATTYPKDLFDSSGPVIRGVFLALVVGVPLAVGLFVADGLDPRHLTWRRLAVHLAILAAMLGLLALLHWWFALMVLGGIALVAYVTALAMRLAGRGRVPGREVQVVLGHALVAVVALTLAGQAPSIVDPVLQQVPQMPLGGRISNEILNPPEAHPSVTHGRTGFLLVDTVLARDWVALGDVVMHLILPAITLGYFSLAIITRIMRASMLDVLQLDFVRTARAKGLPEREVVRAHARRNALIPIATVIGLTFGSLLGGAVLTETIFQWPGLGRWSTQAIGAGDAQSIMAFTLFVVIVYLVVNFVVDVVYSLIDPRVRLS